MHTRFAQRMRERSAEHRRIAAESGDTEARSLHLELAEEFAARAAEVEHGELRQAH